MTHTVEYRAADRANRWATTALVLAIVTLAISLTFFWFYGIPPLVFGATSLYYAHKAHVEGTARQGQSRAAIGLVALSMVLMLRVTAEADPLAREDLAFALSVVLLGLLVMVTRRNAVSQVVGFMSLENGLVLAATGAKGMPLVVEISVAFSILIAFIVIGIFLFRIRERFDSVDVSALDDFRGEQR